MASPQEDELVRTLFVGGLPDDIRTREIYNLFRLFPGFRYCSINHIGDRKTPVSFVSFSHHTNAVAAMDTMQGILFDPEDSKYLKIELAKSNSKFKKKNTLHHVRGEKITIPNDTTRSTAPFSRFISPSHAPFTPIAMNQPPQPQNEKSHQGQAANSSTQTSQNFFADSQACEVQSFDQQQQQQQKHFPFLDQVPAHQNPHGQQQQKSFQPTPRSFFSSEPCKWPQSLETTPQSHQPDQGLLLSPNRGNPQPFAPQSGQAAVREPCRTIFMGNVHATQKEALENTFQAFEGFVRLKISQKENNLLCWADFESTEHAKLALQFLQFRTFEATPGREFRAEFAKNKMLAFTNGKKNTSSF